VSAPAHGGASAATAAAHPAPQAAEHAATPTHEASPALHGTKAPEAPAAGAHAAAPGGQSAHDAHLVHVAHRNAMIASVVVGTLGIALAFVVYFFGWINPDRVAEKFAPVHTFLKNKWYFDELYEATVISGTKALSRAMGWFDNNVVDGLVNLVAQIGVWVSFLIGKFDNYVVDGAVNGVADVTIGSGSFFRRFQTGKLYHYVYVAAGGVIIIYLVKAF